MTEAPRDAVAALEIASFKLQLVERRVRIVPARDAAGCTFEGPGVDLVGEEAAEALGLAEPLFAWLRAREPVRVRSLSLDVGRRRLLATLETDASQAPARPRVVRIDPAIDAGAITELLARAAPLLRRLGEVAAVKLARRAVR